MEASLVEESITPYTDEYVLKAVPLYCTKCGKKLKLSFQFSRHDPETGVPYYFVNVDCFDGRVGEYGCSGTLLKILTWNWHNNFTVSLGPYSAPFVVSEKQFLMLLTRAKSKP